MIWKGDFLGKERRNNNKAEKKQDKEKRTWNENGITCRKKKGKKIEKRLDNSISRGNS